MKLLTIAMILTLFTSCVSFGKKFQGMIQSSASRSESQDVKEEMIRLTNDGKTLPSAETLNRVVSNPGNVPSVPCPKATVGETNSEAGNLKLVSFSTKNVSSPFRKNVSPNGKYGSYSYSLKRHPRPRRGCLPVENVSFDQAKAALASQKLTYKTERGSKAATQEEVRTLGAAILSVQHLNGGPIAMGMPASGQPKPLPFEFSDSAGSQQFGNRIKIGRGSRQYGTSVAQHVHEWAHLIGNNGGYDRYRSEVGVPPYCNVSGYSANNSKNSRRKEYNEHFAEVMTAFVTEPASLKNHPNSACRKAFDFFKKFFKKGERAQECM